MYGLSSMAIDIKSPAEIDKMRAVGVLAAATLKMLGEHIAPGVTTGQLNKLCHEFTLDHGATPATLGYKGFPASMCTSINDVVCHGIPKDGEVLREGDIVNLDVTSILAGYHGDTSRTFYVGGKEACSPEAVAVVEAAREALDIGVAQVKPKARIGDIGAAIEQYANGLGFGVVRDYCGHGIGRTFHAEPQVAHYRSRGMRNPRMKPGMTFTIEPMINVGTWKVTAPESDGWTVRTRDRKLSAQFEHTVLVTPEGVEVLTDFAKIEGSPYA
jgi:methionyl aminopeptidase